MPCLQERLVRELKKHVKHVMEESVAKEHTHTWPIIPWLIGARFCRVALFWDIIDWLIDYFFFLPKLQGWYSETGFHIGMDRNFVCLWRRRNCRSQVIDLSLSALISWFAKSITGFLNNSNLHAKISTLLIINLFPHIRRNYNYVPHFNLLQSFNYTLYLFCKKTLQISNQFFLYMDPGFFFF